ncbi:MAG: glycosyltransferase family 39 protein [Candidatus Dadabacteria bacterium]|nr:glycosyltransferase family 39 protein [Candidatus Dadabacteria bacterium]
MWAVFLLAAYLSVTGLGNVEFWDDEIETVWMSRALVEHGSKFGWDGRNAYDYGGGLYLNDKFESTFPPVSFYTGALSLKLFGKTEGGGRTAFGLMGIACLGVFLLLLRLEIPDNPRLRLAAMAIFSLSPVYLLHTRQMRYYAPALLFTALAFYLYRLYVKDRGRWRGFPWSIWAAAACCCLLFFTHFAAAAAFFGALATGHLLFAANRSKREWHLWGAALAAGAVCVWYLFSSGYITPDLQVKSNVFSIFYREESRLARIWSLLPLYLRFINVGGLAPWFVGLWVCWLAGKRIIPGLRAREDEQTPLYYGVTGFLLVIVCAVLSPQQEYDQYAATRFFFTAALFFAVPTAFFCMKVLSRSRAAGAVLMFLLLCTTLWTWPFGVQNHPPLNRNYSPLDLSRPAWKSVNIFSFESNYTQWTLPAMAREFHTKKPNFLSDLEKFFEKRGKQDEVMWVSPTWSYYNVMWYLGEKFLFCCTYARTHAVAPRNLEKYGIEIRYAHTHTPDWIVLVGPSRAGQARSRAAGRILAYELPNEILPGQAVRFGAFREEAYQLVKVLGRLYFPVWRPELFWHSFRRPVDVGADPRRGDVLIFRRVGGG